MDGCGHVRTFLRVIVPNAGGAFLTVFLFSLVWYWSDYYLASINLSSVQTLATRIVDLRYALEVILPREHFTVYYICLLYTSSAASRTPWPLKRARI